MRISDWSSDVCSSDLGRLAGTVGDRHLAGDGGTDGIAPRQLGAIEDEAHVDREAGGGREIDAAPARDGAAPRPATELADLEPRVGKAAVQRHLGDARAVSLVDEGQVVRVDDAVESRMVDPAAEVRSEEHTSELQS